MGFTKTTLESMGTVWGRTFAAYPARKCLVFAVAIVNYKEEVLFQVNYRADLSTANVVRYNGMLYNITRIDIFEGYKEGLTLYCIAKK